MRIHSWFVSVFVLLAVPCAICAQDAEEADRFFFNGKDLYESYNYAEAAERFQSAAAIVKELGADRIGDAASLYEWIGDCYEQERSFDDALAFYGKALTIHEGLGEHERIVVDLTNVGRVYHTGGRYPEALEYFQKTLQLDESMEKKRTIAADLNNVGTLHLALGHYRQALECFQRMLSLNEESGNKSGIVLGLNNLGILYDAWGLYEQAIDCYEGALAIEEELGRKVETAIRLTNIGTVYYRLGNSEKALHYYLRALGIDERLGRKADVATSINNIAEVHRSLGRQEEALTCFTIALAIVEDLGDRPALAKTLNNIGMVYQSLGQYEKTLDYFQRALKIDESMGDQAAIALLLNNIGSVYWRSANYQKAEEYLARSIDLLERLRRTAPGAIRRNYLDSQIDTYRWLIQTYMRTNAPARAFDAAELSSAKYLIEQMSGRLDEGAVRTTSIVEFQHRIPNNSAVLNYTNVGRSGIISRIYADRHRIIAEEIDLDPFIARIDSHYGSLIHQILEVLERSWVKRTSGRVGFEDIVSCFRHLMTKPQPSAVEITAIRDIARALRKLLLLGLEGVLADKAELLVLPGGILAYLPFEALITSEGNYLVENYQITYGQSLTVCEMLDERKYDSEQKKPLLAFGGAVYEEEHGSETHVESERQLEAVKRNAVDALSRGLSVKVVYDQLGYGTWQNLPGTMAEVEGIKAAVPGAYLITGRGVDEDTVKKLSEKGELKNYRVIHFATHGLVVPEMPELSALVLSQRGKRDDAEDGYLRMGEIVKLDLEAYFVNLSACETGIGKIYGGEGVVGLTQSFLVGGANGLSVSLWQVADESTIEFMVGMYRLAHREGMSYAKALAEMKRRFIHGKYPDPFFWAPFVYYGK